MANSYNTSNENSFGKKMKQFITNRAVIVTLITLVLAIGVMVAVTVAASRSRRPVGDGNESGTTTVTNKGDAGAFAEETLPTYNGGETLPVGGGEATDPKSLSLSLPTQGKMTKGHDSTLQVYSTTMGDYRVHLGVDIATAENAPVYAAAAGKVEKIWEDALMGVCVAIDHGESTMTVYKNLDATLADGITAGSTVKAGQAIGRVGDTAISEMADEPHLHFEMTVKGLQVNPMDYFKKEDVAILTNENADGAYESAAVTEAVTKGK